MNLNLDTKTPASRYLFGLRRRLICLIRPFEPCEIRLGTGVTHTQDEINILWRHIGHWPLAESCLIHSRMQCCPTA